jgi:hypothetical protein
VPVTPRDGGQINVMQALKDVTCWRTGRLAAPCFDCVTAQDGRCDDHACDLSLIASYRRTILLLQTEP